jgi:hypothetical protein
MRVVQIKPVRDVCDHVTVVMKHYELYNRMSELTGGEGGGSENVIV